jgi:dihydroorotase
MTINSTPLLIKNGHIIDPAQQLDEILDLLIVNGKIAGLSKSIENLPYKEYKVISAESMVVCPGFIDLHCHLRQPGNEDKETIATGSRAAARGGFTTICCMPNTIPPLDNRETINYVNSVAINESIVRVLPIGCITKERKGQVLSDMLDLITAGVVAFSDDGSSVMDENIMTSALKYSIVLGKPIIDHCENTRASSEWDMNGGALATKLGLRGMPDNSEEDIIRRDVDINKTIGGKLHIAHVSTAGSVEIIRKAKRNGCKVTAEVTPNHLTLTEEKVSGYNTNTKVNPPLRTEKDIKALIDGLNDGTLDAIATDHAPHAKKDKDCPYKDAAFGISGFETTFGSLMSLVHGGLITLNMLITKLTYGPARILGSQYKNMGSLFIGNPADITIFDTEYTWVVKTDNFISKGKNSPLDGVSLKGKVVTTIFNGDIIHKDETVNYIRRLDNG